LSDNLTAWQIRANIFAVELRGIIKSTAVVFELDAVGGLLIAALQQIILLRAANGEIGACEDELKEK
jgi:hypothetical protein